MNPLVVLFMGWPYGDLLSLEHKFMKEWFEVTGEEVPSGTHFLIDTEPGEKVILMGGSIFDKIEPRALISNLSFSFGVSQVRILDSHDHVPPGIDEE